MAAKKISRISLLILRKILRKVILKKEAFLVEKKRKESERGKNAKTREFATRK